MKIALIFYALVSFSSAAWAVELSSLNLVSQNATMRFDCPSEYTHVLKDQFCSIDDFGKSVSQCLSDSIPDRLDLSNTITHFAMNKSGTVRLEIVLNDRRARTMYIVIPGEIGCVTRAQKLD